MEYTPQRWSFLAKVAVIGGILLALFVFGYYTGYFRKDCGQDKNCFQEKVKDCKPAQVAVLRNNNAYLYWVGNQLGKFCEINIKALRIDAGAPPEFKALEGKEMSCDIPKTELQKMDIDSFDNLLTYCHGPLKEGLYEVIIQRMYTLVVSQLGDIIKEAQKVLKEV
ncbi:hypothetical protein HYS50_03765 [Candidatus Woesearchaeota archaeon]|nr:hypothetical protein [Candidatus Woesearchaeota archaeon]